MKRFNIILLVDASGEHVLMCRRLKPPYQRLLNLVGGKAKDGEDGLHAAYRELREETGVSAKDTTLTLVATFAYPMGGAGLPPYELQAYAGRLKRALEVHGDENPLCWVSLQENFFDMKKYAGEGSVGHVLETVRRYRPELIERREATIALLPLREEDLPIVAYYRGCTEDALHPMLEQSEARMHDGRYYEQFSIRLDGCMCGLASLFQHDEGTVSDGIEVYPPFRGCGIAAQTLGQLAERARESGYCRLTAQVRTDNAPSIALHRRAGFTILQTYVNRRGNEVYDMEKSLSVRHEMRLRPKPFAMIASGAKTYELRLHDEKRRLIHVGDEILFTCTADDRKVLTRVTELRPFADFAALYASLPLMRCGYTPENVHRADPRDMEAYYPPEKQACCGVLAIGVERIRYPLQMLSEGFTVRELTVEDVPQMLRLALGNPLYYEHMKMTPTAANLAETLTALPPKRTLADKHFIGWYEGEQMVALMDLIAHHPWEDAAFIGWFMVEAQRQGKGLGRHLIKQTLDMLKAQGVREVRLGRVEGNPQSRQFWLKCGFEDTEFGYETDEYRVKVMTRRLE